jgi:osmotically-inducible protein OsmY
MKPDAQMKQDIAAELAWDPAVRSSAVGVAVQQGVVTLTGHLESYAGMHAVARAVERVADVQAIVLELDVRLAPAQRRSDTDIAASIEQALRCNACIPPRAVRVTVDHGEVTLHGEVEWEHQRRSAEQAVRPLAGVVGISNEIGLRPRASASNLKRRIEEALIRQAIREAHLIGVAVEGSTVKLTGAVHSLQERRAAQGVAWRAPGVDSVVNELRVD